MSIGSALARGRTLAAQGMSDQCAVTRPGEGAPVLNPETGGYTYPDPVTVYTGKCKVQLQATEVRVVDLGGQAVNLTRIEVQLPMTATGVQVQDTIEITDAKYDDDLIGRTYTVEGPSAKSQATARRLACQEILRTPTTSATAPEGS